MRGPLPCFIDTSAWIALAVVKDPYHHRAKEKWHLIYDSGAKCFTSIPIILEAFTFLERNTDKQTALLWKNEIERLSRLSVWECTKRDLRDAWKWFDRKDLHKLSAVDATSFALMTRHKVRSAFAFDTHFSIAGFRIL